MAVPLRRNEEIEPPVRQNAAPELGAFSEVTANAALA